MKTLIGMTDFVLEQQEKFKSDRFYFRQFKDNVINYANFLKQPLTLGMFVPVDSHGVILDELKFCCTSSDCGCMGMPVNVSSMEEIDEYYEAKEKVLFKDANVTPVEDYYIVKIGKREVWITWTERTIEDVQHINRAYEVDFELTESALKQIGL